MFTIKYQDENSASAALSQLLRQSSIARQVFWKLVRLEAAPPELPDGVSIDHLHLTDQGREIDILLHLGSFGVIVECKVNDSKKPYQLDAYVDYWRRTHKKLPHLVWLLEKDQKVLGDDRFHVRTVTWRQLRVALKDAADGASMMEDAKLTDFCDALLRAGIGKRETDVPQPERRARGYRHNHAESILRSILHRCPNLVGSPMTMNATPPAIHAGKTIWSRALDDDWVSRIWLCWAPLSAEPNQPGPFHFHAQVLLFQGGFSNKASRNLELVPKWAAHLRRRGLSMRRNQLRSWTRGADLAPGEGITRGVNYVLAEETLKDAQTRFAFDWRSDAAAIAAGAAHLNHFVTMFDDVLTQE